MNDIGTYFILENVKHISHVLLRNELQVKYIQDNNNPLRSNVK